MRFPFRRKKGEFDISVVFWGGGIIVMLIFVLYYVFSVLFPDAVPRFW